MLCGLCGPHGRPTPGPASVLTRPAFQRSRPCAVGRCPPLCSTGRHLPQARQCSRHWACSGDRDHRALPSGKGRPSEADRPQRAQSSPSAFQVRWYRPAARTARPAPGRLGRPPSSSLPLSTAPTHGCRPRLRGPAVTEASADSSPRGPSLTPVWFASGAVWVKKLSLSQTGDPRQSLVTAVPRPNAVSARPGFPHSHAHGACPPSNGAVSSWAPATAPTQSHLLSRGCPQVACWVPGLPAAP